MKVKLMLDGGDNDGGTIDLPFAPFPQLMLQVPSRGGDYMEVNSVFWNNAKKEFEVFLND